MPLSIVVILDQMIDFIEFSHEMDSELSVWHT